LLFAALLMLRLLTKFYLASRQIRHVHGTETVPAAFASTINGFAPEAADYAVRAGRCWK
jgi:STE24 endopeptidase